MKLEQIMTNGKVQGGYPRNETLRRKLSMERPSTSIHEGATECE